MKNQIDNLSPEDRELFQGMVIDGYGAMTESGFRKYYKREIRGLAERLQHLRDVQRFLALKLGKAPGIPQEEYAALRSLH